MGSPKMPETTTILPDRLAVLATLAKGQHDTPDDGMCAVEAAAWIAGDEFGDHPSCVSPVIAAFCRSWNDDLPQADRDRLLLHLVPRIIGTDGSTALEERRSLMAADWLVREHTPAWLRLAGLTAQADTLEALPEITSMAQVPSIRGPLEAVRKNAAAAWAAAGAAAWAKLAPTKAALQQSALRLIERMIEAREAA